MDSAKDDPFETASHCLERLAQLKEKKLLEEAEYQELRELLIAEMKRSATLRETLIVQDEKPSERGYLPSVPYGQLHSVIVQQIESTYKGAGENAKQRIFRAMVEMAEKQALYPGDSGALTELVQTVFDPVEGREDSNTEPSWKLVQTQQSLIEIAARIRDSKETSPAAKAIAETALHSTARATREFSVEHKKAMPNRTSLPIFWGKFVLKDIEGGFEEERRQLQWRQHLRRSSPSRCLLLLLLVLSWAQESDRLLPMLSATRRSPEVIRDRTITAR